MNAIIQASGETTATEAAPGTESTPVSASSDVNASAKAELQAKIDATIAEIKRLQSELKP